MSDVLTLNVDVADSSVPYEGNILSIGNIYEGDVMSNNIIASTIEDTKFKVAYDLITILNFCSCALVIISAVNKIKG